jgi:transposase InsO family protein
MYPDKSMEYICSLFGKSRQAWYDSQNRKEEQQMEGVLVLSLVKDIRKDHKQMGTDKLHLKLEEDFKDHHIKMGRDKLHLLLSQHDMLVRQRKYKPRTTDSNHPYKRYSNLVRDIILTTACRLWASDITYIRTKMGFVYLSLITDCYSHKIVGWCLWPSLESKGSLNALEMALASNPDHTNLIHHSDRGIQYCCNDYIKALNNNKIAISMTENGDPYENALAERVNGILKMEYELNNTFSDFFEAHEQVKKAVEVYNNSRPHRSCNMLTPAQAHQQTGFLKKHWKKREYKQIGLEPEAT